MGLKRISVINGASKKFSFKLQVRPFVIRLKHNNPCFFFVVILPF